MCINKYALTYIPFHSPSSFDPFLNDREGSYILSFFPYRKRSRHKPPKRKMEKPEKVLKV